MRYRGETLASFESDGNGTPVRLTCRLEAACAAGSAGLMPRVQPSMARAVMPEHS
jgi:hypothetical protein